MSFVPRKPEIEEVAAAIEHCQTLDEVAKVALKASWSVIQRRQLWMIGTDLQIAYGPYSSANDAFKALALGRVPEAEEDEGSKVASGKGYVAVSANDGHAGVHLLVGPERAKDATNRLDIQAHRTANHLCVTCDHRIEAHGVSSTRPGCSIAGCACKAPKKP